VFDGENMKRLNNTIAATRKYPSLSQEIAKQLVIIPCTTDRKLRYYPCRVNLKNGKVENCVYLIEAQSYINAWGVWPDQRNGVREISASDIVKIEPSPFRLPAPLAQYLYRKGESGMGYYLFEILYKDGLRSAHLAGGRVDFVNLKPGKSMPDVAEVLPTRSQDPLPQYEAPEYCWCLYEKE